VHGFSSIYEEEARPRWTRAGKVGNLASLFLPTFPRPTEYAQRYTLSAFLITVSCNLLYNNIAEGLQSDGPDNPAASLLHAQELGLRQS
jgi:hypothetical protein